MKFIVAENISRACKLAGLNSVSLGEKSGTSQPTMNRLMTAREDTQDPRLGTIEAAGEALKIDVWKFFFENFPETLLREKRLGELIKMLGECSEETQNRVILNAFDTINLCKLKQQKEH